MNTTGSIGLIFNEIITNTFKHSMGNANKNPTLNIDVNKKENKLLTDVTHLPEI